MNLKADQSSELAGISSHLTLIMEGTGWRFGRSESVNHVCTFHFS